jgi:HTH-type transcriptional regulator, competence development regulator
MPLGEILKTARLKAGLTLRAVEGETGISNGYLSQLESDTVKTPSPRHLFQLARVYGLPYQALMAAADYPIPEGDQGRAAVQPAEGLVFATGFLTPEDENKVRGYIDALRSQYAAVRAPPPAPKTEGETT